MRLKPGNRQRLHKSIKDKAILRIYYHPELLEVQKSVQKSEYLILTYNT